MALLFEWNVEKAQTNLQKHGVSFEEAAEVFSDPLMKLIHDPHHSALEDRFIAVGMSMNRRIVVAVHTDRGDRIRIVSARLATRSERKQYETDK
jgi:uncharacterized DUF497 family protein